MSDNFDIPVQWLVPIQQSGRRIMKLAGNGLKLILGHSGSNKARALFLNTCVCGSSLHTLPTHQRICDRPKKPVFLKCCLSGTCTQSRLKKLTTRMHSSRMRTVHSLTIVGERGCLPMGGRYLLGVPAQVGCLPRGVPA